MTENYCGMYKGKKVEHSGYIVDFEQIKSFNDNTDEGRYDLIYMCRGCGIDWTEKDVVLLNLPEVDSELRERYRFKKRVMIMRRDLNLISD